MSEGKELAKSVAKANGRYVCSLSLAVVLGLRKVMMQCNHVIAADQVQHKSLHLANGQVQDFASYEEDDVANHRTSGVLNGESPEYPYGFAPLQQYQHDTFASNADIFEDCHDGRYQVYSSAEHFQSGQTLSLEEICERNIKTYEAQLRDSEMQYWSNKWYDNEWRAEYSRGYETLALDTHRSAREPSATASAFVNSMTVTMDQQS